jgi:hypothetical protein
MLSKFKLLAVLQLALTVAATTPATPFRNGLYKFPERTNNNTWIVADAEFNYPGPTLKPIADDVGAIGFTLRRSVLNQSMETLKISFAPVAEDKKVYCGYATELQLDNKSEWKQCNGYSWENTPLGDSSMAAELNDRLRYRLLDLKMSPSGTFESVTLEIVNHVVPST